MARCRTGRCRRIACISTRPAGTRCWPAARCSPSRPSPSRTARSAIDGGGRPGPVFFHGVGPGTNVFDQLRGQAERWNGEGQADRRRRLDARLARAARQPAARARFPRPCPAGRLGSDPPQTGRVGVAGHARGRARLRRRPARPGGRAGPAGRAHQPSAAPSQARRPVHRGSHGNRRGRSGGAPGIRHRPLRRAGDAHGHRCAARLPAADLRRRREAVPAGREHRGAVALRQRRPGRGARQAGRRRLAVAQGADEAAHPRHGGPAHPHRRGAQDPRRRDHGAGRGRLGRVLRPLPVRRDRGPVSRHRRCAGGPGRRAGRWTG